MKYKTKTAANFRSPEKINAVMLTLGKGETLIKIDMAGVHYMGFDFVAVMHEKFEIIGYVAQHLIVEEKKYITPPVSMLPHRPTNNPPKNARTTRAHTYPIEFQDFSGDYAERFEKTVKFLDVKKAEAFLPTRKDTYCNIAAYQFAYQMGVFLPRLWWNNPADEKNGAAVEFGKNVHEVSANGLFRWLTQHGRKYGWRAGIVSDAKKSLTVAVTLRHGPGHIAIIRPDGATWEAGRNLHEKNLTWREWFDSRHNLGALIFTNAL